MSPVAIGAIVPIYAVVLGLLGALLGWLLGWLLGCAATLARRPYRPGVTPEVMVTRILRP